MQNETAMRKCWIGIEFRSPRPDTFDVPIQRVRFAIPVMDHKSSRYRHVALLSGTLLNAATVNVRLGGIPEPVRYPSSSKDTADDQCGSIVASGLPWPGCIASIRLLRIEPSIVATLQIATLAGALLPSAIGMRMHNDPIVS